MSANPADRLKPVTAHVGDAIRGEFPIFEHTTYLNSCSQGALSRRVRDAVEGWLAGWDENGAEWDFWVERNEAFRSTIAALLHAGADDVAVTTSVSQGVSALVSALPLGRYGKPEEFAAGAVFLFSDAAKYITGASLQIDGGMIKGVL